MEINFVSDIYKESIKHILNYCFQSPAGLGESFINETYIPENCLGCFDKDRLVALLYIHPYDMYYYGDIVSMGGIGVVSTLPEYRHHSCASNMLVKSLEIMKNRGYTFSALAPFSYSFYRKYGWELGFSNKKYIIPIEKLKGLGTGKGEFRPLTLKDRDRVSQVYRACAAKYNGAIDRNESNWASRLEKIGKNRNYGYGYSRQGSELNGYIFFSMNEGIFHVHEMMYDSLETKLELLRFIYYHSAQVKKVSWQAPLDDNTVLLLDNPRIEQKIEPGMMIRVVDVKMALRSYKYPDWYKGSFTINVDDKWAPWNNGAFEVVIEQGSVAVNEAEETAADISCNINTFSQFMLGYIGLKEAIELGKVSVYNHNIAEELKTIFKENLTYMTESF